jgi:CDP-diacylglycerol--serine O-phosphatidyltransferase
MDKNKWFIGYYNIANLRTMLGMLIAINSAYFALQKNLKLAIILLMLSGICDLFDGAIARKLKRTDNEKAFGIQLDTVADVVSFCVVPTIIFCSQAIINWYILTTCAFYISCGVIRLAYFNTIALPDIPVKYYSGLPVTYISLILPIILIFKSAALSIITFVFVALFFILNVKIPKPHGTWYILFPAMAVMLTILWWYL